MMIMTLIYSYNSTTFIFSIIRGRYNIKKGFKNLKMLQNLLNHPHHFHFDLIQLKVPTLHLNKPKLLNKANIKLPQENQSYLT